MSKKTILRLLILFCAANAAGHLLIFSKLPAEIPVHWGASGEIDGWGPKYMDLVLALIPAGMLLLFQILPKVDPKSSNYEKFAPIWLGFMSAMVLFLGAVSWMAPLTVFGLIPEGSGWTGILISGTLGLIFIVLGNYMPRVRQNYLFGIKTPWTLADEHVWERTHRMGGYVFILMGAALILFGAAAPRIGDFVPAVILLVSVFAGTGWLFLYSYLVYTGKMR
ncbi:MAG: SdpI family protein [Lachnospiraceae bacterium]|nr:SdpI family protein [Lachnospiraceae bacterium]